MARACEARATRLSIRSISVDLESWSPRMLASMRSYIAVSGALIWDVNQAKGPGRL